jgi:hypothetical protein
LLPASTLTDRSKSGAAILPEIHAALGIKPWDDDREMLARALEAAHV